MPMARPHLQSMVKIREFVDPRRRGAFVLLALTANRALVADNFPH